MNIQILTGQNKKLEGCEKENRVINIHTLNLECS